MVGAGISGLTAGFRLRQRGFDVTVLEAAQVVGGKMGSVRRDGFTINRGAQLLPTAYRDAVKIARDAGLGPQLEEFTPVLGVMREGRRHTLRASGPGMAIDGLRTGLLSARSQLLLPRLAVDAFRMRKALTYDAHDARARWDTESVTDYCDRRLNAEIRDYLIDPLMRGLFLVDSSRMSIVDFFFTAVNLLGSRMLHYPAGYDFLCRGLAERVNDLRFEARVDRVERTAEGVEVSWSEDGAERSATAEGCVIALPGNAVPRIHAGIDPRIAEILTRDLEHSVVIGAHLGLSRRPAGDVVAVTVPAREMDGLGAVTFDHVVMPACAPPGKGLVSAYFDDEWSAPRCEHSDDELLAEALPLVERVVPGIHGQIELSRIDRWAPSTPVSRVGMHALTAELNRLIDPADPIQLAGDFTSIATVNGCVVSGEAAATRLANSIRRGGAVSPPPVPQSA